MATAIECNACGRLPASEMVTLWDGNTYCRTCIDEVAPELWKTGCAGLTLEETIDPVEISPIHFLRAGLKYAFLMSLIVPGIPVFLGWRVNEISSTNGLLFFGGAFAFFSFWMFVAAYAREGNVKKLLPRTLTINEGELHVKCADTVESFPLSELTWFEGKTEWDEVCSFTEVRHGIVLHAGEKYFGCGRSPEMLRVWRAFLALSEVSWLRPYGCLGLLLIVGLSGLIFGTIGLSIGHAVAPLANDRELPLRLLVLGAIDGLALGLIYCGHKAGQRQKLTGFDRFRAPIMFGVIGMSAGGQNSAIGAVIGIVLNALLPIAFIGLLNRREKPDMVPLRTSQIVER